MKQNMHSRLRASRKPSSHRDAVDLPVGSIVAERFRVERRACAGGMGTVFKARDLQSGQAVALKFISQVEPEGLLRFSREARVLAELSHPSIVRYVAHGRSRDMELFLAMEWLDGRDLRARLADTGLSWTESISLITRICEGLSLAHRRGIVHRDIKPSNIFLVADDPGRAKLLDFGVAWQGPCAAPLTREGAVVGTVGYMAPEQATGSGDIDSSADVFAIGCVLFELLTGRTAFAAQHDVAVLTKVLWDERTKPSELRPELGEDVDSLLHDALAIDRAKRPRDADALLARLRDLSAPERDSVPPRSSRVTPSPVQAEQRVGSVILGSPIGESAETLGSAQSKRDAERLSELIATFDATPIPLFGGGLGLSFVATDQARASDQAVRAARCALRLRSLQPRLALALATGVIGDGSDDERGTAFERATTLLDGHASPGSIRIDELTAGLIGTRFQLARWSGGMELTREELEVEVPRLLLGRPTPCVGRTKELALLEATLTECIEDSVARAVLVTAPPGIGKSRLAHEFLESVSAQGRARVFVARADPVSSGSPLGLIQDLVRAAMGVRAGEPSAVQQRRIQTYLRELLPAAADVSRCSEFYAELLGVPVRRNASPLLRTARTDPEVMREQVRRALSAGFAAETAHGPVLLVLEDLHWGDLASVNYLGLAIALAVHRPLMVLALARPEVQQAFPRLWEDVEVLNVPLRGLSRRPAERLAAQALACPESSRMVQRIVELAEGNVFYLEELIRRAADGGTDFPETVLAMVQSRLDQLEPEERRALRAASVFGERCWPAGVAALLGGAPSLEGTLEALVEKEILLRKAQSRFPDHVEYAFRHALLRDAAYRTLTASDRAHAHEAAGTWLEHTGERDPRVLADHYERGGDSERALPWLVRAALSAVERGDFAAAQAISTRGLTLGATGHLRGTLLLARAHAQAWAFDAEVSQLPEALELLPHATPQWWLAVSVLMFSYSSSGDQESATRYLMLAATTEPGPELTGFYGQALQTIASASVVTGQTQLGWTLLERFDALPANDPRCDQLFPVWMDLARSHLTSYSPYRGQWMLEQALRWAQHGVEAMDAAGSKTGETVALFMLGSAWLFCGNYGEAEGTLRKSARSAEQTGNTLVRNYSTALLAWTLVRSRRYDEAQATLHTLQGVHDENVRNGMVAIEASLELGRGSYEAAVELARQAARGPAAPWRRQAWCVLARAQLELGHASEALEAVAASAGDGNAAPNIEFAVELQNTRARALLLLGEHAAACEAVRAARAFLDEVAAGFRVPDLRRTFLDAVPAHRELGQLEATLRA